LAVPGSMEPGRLWRRCEGVLLGVGVEEILVLGT